MSYRIEEQVRIDAPRQLVWDIIQNPARRIEWDARVVSAEFLSPPPCGKGSIIRVTVKMFGMEFPAVMEYVNWAPPGRSAVRTVDGYGNTSDAAGSWRFDDNPDGSTTFSTTIMLSKKGKIFGRIFEQVMGSAFERLTRQSLQNLKKLVEAEYRVQVRQAVPVLA